MKILSILLVLFFCILTNLHSFSGEGNGTETDPYQITNVNQLQEMKDDLEAHYILMNDIDASGTKDWNGGEGFIPLGADTNNVFEGSLDGGGYFVSDLTINNTNWFNEIYATGLFGHIGPNGTLSNLKLIEVKVSGIKNNGGLCGYLNGGKISNCNVSGTVTGNYYVGGLCCINEYGKISNCFSDVKSEGATDSWDEGGSAGFCSQNSGTITNSYSIGLVSGRSNTGGFCSINSGTITECYSFGYVNAIYLPSTIENVGGFCGENLGHIEKSFSTGLVAGMDFVGGFCGKNFGSIKDCYSTGNIQSHDKTAYVFGGFCGKNGDQNGEENGSIINCYSVGKGEGTMRKGGFCGYNPSKNILNSFWDIETSGISFSYDGKGLTTTEMQKRSTFENAGWDFDTTWCIGEDKTYPQLQWFVDCTTLSVGDYEYSSDKLNIYPNPTDGKFTISLNSDIPIETINIYNIYGQLVAEYNNIISDNISINPNLPQGIYYAEAISGRRKYTGQFVVGR